MRNTLTPFIYDDTILNNALNLVIPGLLLVMAAAAAWCFLEDSDVIRKKLTAISAAVLFFSIGLLVSSIHAISTESAANSNAQAQWKADAVDWANESYPLDTDAAVLFDRCNHTLTRCEPGDVRVHGRAVELRFTWIDGEPTLMWADGGELQKW